MMSPRSSLLVCYRACDIGDEGLPYRDVMEKLILAFPSPEAAPDAVDALRKSYPNIFEYIATHGPPHIES
eukprot:2058481-Pyramimonas_sp.AAC.1